MKAFQRTKTILLLTGFIIGSIPFAEAQQRKAVSRVGVLEPGFRRPEATAPSACNGGFREGLRELGWIEGQNLRIEQRHGEFKPINFRDSLLSLSE